MSVDLIGVVRDVLVIAYMFVLRIGVPLLITLMIGAWLRKLLEEKQPVSQEKSVEAPKPKEIRP